MRPAHHNLEANLDAYIVAAGIRDAGKAPLFRSAVRHRRADRKADAPHRRLAHGSAPRGRSRDARAHWLPHVSGDGHHGLSRSGGTLENAQAMAGHESPRTTKLYDPTGDEITLDEVERIAI
jgi:integrase/recombinase XerD